MFELKVDEKGFYHIEEQVTIEDITKTIIELEVDENGYFHIKETFE